MKFNLWVCLATVFCCLLQPVLCYTYGYYGTPANPFFFLLMLRLAVGLLIVTLLAALVRAAIQRRGLVLPILSLVGCFVVNAAAVNWFRTDVVILTGMVRRLGDNSMHEDMRHFAREFVKMPYPPEADLSDARKFYWYRDLVKAGVVGKYPFLSLLGEAVVIQDGNLVRIVSGRPKKGVYVSVDGSEVDPRSYLGAKVSKVKTDVVFVVDMN